MSSVRSARSTNDASSRAISTAFWPPSVSVRSWITARLEVFVRNQRRRRVERDETTEEDEPVVSAAAVHDVRPRVARLVGRELEEEVAPRLAAGRDRVCCSEFADEVCTHAGFL